MYVYVKVSSGRVYGCDLVISATGVCPAGDMYRNVVEVDTEGGVEVDHNMLTSDPDIYAAGDICSASWKPSTFCSSSAVLWEWKGLRPEMSSKRMQPSAQMSSFSP